MRRATSYVKVGKWAIRPKFLHRWTRDQPDLGLFWRVGDFKIEKVCAKDPVDR